MLLNQLSIRRRVLLILAAFTVIGLGIGTHRALRLKRFAVVQPGVLYRSGVLKPWQLRSVVHKYGIRTVFSLTHTGNDEEEAVCRELGVRREFQYLSGDGVGPDDPYLKFLEIMSDPSNHPVLVHCSAGVQRTGGAVLLYRCVFQQWPFEKACNEMLAAGNDGNMAQRDQMRRMVAELTQPANAMAERKASTPNVR